MENKEQKGQMLKQAREAKGLSLQAVHATTKIPMDILRALEEGYTVRTLTPFYYRGFVKIYAQYLGIDLMSILSDYHPEQVPSAVPSRAARQNVFEIQSRLMRKQEKIQGIVKVVLILLAFFFVIKVFGFIIHKIKNRPARAVPAAATVSRPEKIKKETPVAAHPKTSVPSTPATVASVSDLQEEPKSGKKLNLTVRANKNSWLRVKADNATVFQSTLNKGGVETWMADNDIEISGRNINQLEFEFNGKLIGPLGRENREVRKVIFTKDGLSVQK